MQAMLISLDRLKTSAQARMLKDMKINRVCTAVFIVSCSDDTLSHN